METLTFEYQGGLAVAAPPPAVLAGVVGSGNLEILVEAEGPGDRCTIVIITAATGFEAIWQAVMDDFVARHRPGGVRLSINDVGATPAVVSLRLEQAWESFKGGQP
jgi:malonate decarboxylase delta subunit